MRQRECRRRNRKKDLEHVSNWSDVVPMQLPVILTLVIPYVNLSCSSSSKSRKPQVSQSSANSQTVVALHDWKGKPETGSQRGGTARGLSCCAPVSGQRDGRWLAAFYVVPVLHCPLVEATSCLSGTNLFARHLNLVNDSTLARSRGISVFSGANLGIFL